MIQAWLAIFGTEKKFYAMYFSKVYDFGNVMQVV